MKIVHRLPSAAYGRNQRRVEGGKGRRVEDEKKITNYKKMAVIIGYLKCSLKKAFQDATKKFLQKKQEIGRYVIQIYTDYKKYKKISVISVICGLLFFFVEPG